MTQDKRDEDEEIRKLERGEWVVLGCIVTSPDPCPEAKHCASCPGEKRTTEDSCWGIVVENQTEKAEELAKEMF